MEAIRRARDETRRAEDLRIEEERRRLRDASERRKRTEEEAVARQLSAIKDIGDRAKELSQMVKEKVEGERTRGGDGPAAATRVWLRDPTLRANNLAKILKPRDRPRRSPMSPLEKTRDPSPLCEQS